MPEFLFVNSKMLAAQQIVAVAPAAGASERDRIESRLFAMLANAGCLDVTTDNLVKAGVTTIPLVNCMADSRDTFRAFVGKACHLGDSLSDMAEAAKIISVYVVSESTTLVEAKATAERAVQDLPLPANPMDLALHLKTWQAAVRADEIPDALAGVLRPESPRVRDLLGG